MTTSQEWIDAIHKKLKENIKEDKLLLYPTTKLFPRHSLPGHIKNYSGMNAINFHALTSWANENGLDAQADPESTHLDQQSIPFIRFTKR